MKLTPVRIFGVWILSICASGTFAIWAATPWLNKDFKDWTEKEASALVTESPWAKVMPLPSTDRPSQMVLDGSADAGPQSTAATGYNSANSSTTGANQGTEGGNPEPDPGFDASGARSKHGRSRHPTDHHRHLGECFACSPSRTEASFERRPTYRDPDTGCSKTA